MCRQNGLKKFRLVYIMEHPLTEYSKKDITLTVTSQFEVPTYLSKASPPQVEHALRLADAILESGVSFNHNTDIKQYQEKIRQLQTTTVETYREEAVRLAKAELRAEVMGKESLIHELRRQLERLETQLDQQKAEYKSLEQKKDEYQEKLQERIAVQSNSSKRGLQGEQDFEQLTKNMRDWKLDHIGQRKKESADFQTTVHTVEVRFEVKNHETLVPYQKNVDKFERDMKANPSTKVGVFVALKARIEHMDESISIRWSDEKQLLVYIPYFLSRDLTYTYDLIEGLIQTMRHLRPHFETKDTSKDIEILTDKIKKAVDNVQILDAQIKTMYSDYSAFTTKMEANYASLKSIVCTTLSALTGKEQEEMKPKRKQSKKQATE